MRAHALTVAMAVLASCKFPEVPRIDEVDGAVDAGTDGDAAVDANVDAQSCFETTCINSVLSVCGADGVVESIETCPLDCFSSSRCNWLEPSNGLGAHLSTAATQSAVALAAGTTVETDTGVIRAPGGSIVAVATDMMPQPGGTAIRVFMARAWTMADIRVTGSAPVAFVAIEDIEVNGTIDASADGITMAPGSSACVTGQGGSVASSAGHWSIRRAGHSGPGTYVWHTPGAGGGGFGGSGAQGGALTDPPMVGAAGGVANGTVALIPLRGGCSGGGSTSALSQPGRGGGAIQIVSATGEIIFEGGGTLGSVHVGGGGGQGCDNVGSNSGSTGPGCVSAGGGSGGGILIEAPSVRFGVASGVLAAGGGGGGWGGCASARHGQDAPPNAGPAQGGACPLESWGQPPIGGAGATSTAAQVGASTDYLSGGGGGGGHGRIRINTIDGTFAGEANAVLRGVLTTGTVQVQ